jgi:hypothetical protein
MGLACCTRVDSVHTEVCASDIFGILKEERLGARSAAGCSPTRRLFKFDWPLDPTEGEEGILDGGGIGRSSVVGNGIVMVEKAPAVDDSASTLTTRAPIAKGSKSPDHSRGSQKRGLIMRQATAPFGW